MGNSLSAQAPCARTEPSRECFSKILYGSGKNRCYDRSGAAGTASFIALRPTADSSPAGILYVFDIEYNDGRYTAVTKQAVGSLANR